MKSFAIDLCDFNGACTAMMTRPRSSGPQHTTRPHFNYGRSSHRRRRPTASHAARRRTQHWSW
jgi:hypothetical protein